MVNSELKSDAAPLDPEVALAIGYARAEVRERLKLLWRFDARIAQILRTTSQPMIGQMRLTWWHDAVGRDNAIAGEPLLGELAAQGLLGSGLQRVIEGWEALLDDPDDASLAAYATGRAGLFVVAAQISGSGQRVEDAGAGWALVDLARHHSQPKVREQALALAAAYLSRAPRRWDRVGRPLGVLVKLARRDLAGLEPQGSPRRLLAAMRLALTGR